MTIPRIHVKEVDIPNIYTPDWMSRQPNVDHLVPPVVLNIGNPIVNIPGCVKTVSYTHLTLPTIYSV